MRPTFLSSRLGFLLALLLPVAGVQAHHSFAMFDQQGQLRLTGAVKALRWTNPHVYLELEAPDASGKLRMWNIECASVVTLKRIGWKHNLIKAGDAVTVVVAPLRTGEPGALLKQVKLADGRKFGNGDAAGPPGISIDQ